MATKQKWTVTGTLKVAVVVTIEATSAKAALKRARDVRFEDYANGLIGIANDDEAYTGGELQLGDGDVDVEWLEAVADDAGAA